MAPPPPPAAMLSLTSLWVMDVTAEDVGACSFQGLSLSEAAAETTAKKGSKGRAVSKVAYSGSSKGEKAASGPPAAAGGVLEGDNCATDATPAAAAGADTGVEWGPLTRLCQSYVDYILAWEPTLVQDPDEYYNQKMNDPLALELFTQEYVDRNTQSLRRIKEVSDINTTGFKRFQDWARAEFKAKGYVELDDIFIAKGVLLSQPVTKEDWDTAMARVHKTEALELNVSDGVLAEERGEEHGVAVGSN